ncbi:MAG: AAA family ATPase [Nocardioidaceae bacterium]
MPLSEEMEKWYYETYGDPFADPIGQEPKRGEQIFEGTDYPRDWDGFIGQEGAKHQLRVQVASAKARGTRIEHTLLASGLAGVGKSTLAHLLAYQAGVGLIQTTGPLTADEFRTLAKSCQDGDVILIDEIHMLATGNKNKSDWLLPVMSEGKFFGSRGAEKLPNIAIIGATTDVGKLPDTLISRFMVKPNIERYTEDEAALIAGQLARRMDVPVDGDYLPRIARAADRNPRNMRSILTALRDLAVVDPDVPPDFALALKWSGLSEDGLTQVAQDILLLLLAARDNTSSLDSLRAQLGEPGPLRAHEQQLLQRGLIEITGRGRRLTDNGRSRAIQLVRERRS